MKRDQEIETQDPNLWAWICEQLADLEDSTGDDCVDNHRWYQEGDPDGFMEYNDRADSGCCGSDESQAVYPATGVNYFFGLNFGH